MPEDASHDLRPTRGWTTSESSSGQIAGFAIRLGARIVDWLVVAVIGVVMVAVGVPAAGVGGPEMFILLPIVATLYEVPLTAVRGQTLGKMILRIRVVRLDDGLVPGWGKSLGRGVIPMAPALIPLTGWIGALLVYVSVLWDDKRRGWHDKAAKTVVIKI